MSTETMEWLGFAGSVILAILFAFVIIVSVFSWKRVWYRIRHPLSERSLIDCFSDLEKQFERYLAWFGMLMRFVSIVSIGAIGASYFYPDYVLDKPLASITLSEIGGLIAAICIPIAAWRWLFSTPGGSGDFHSEKEVYKHYRETWSLFGIFILGLLFYIISER